MSDDEYREFEEALTDVLTETAYSPPATHPIGERTRSRRPARPSLYRSGDRSSQPRAEADGFTKAPLVQRPPRLAVDADASRHISASVHGEDASDHDGCADHISGALLAFRGLGAIIHSY